MPSKPIEGAQFGGRVANTGTPLEHPSLGCPLKTTDGHREPVNQIEVLRVSGQRLNQPLMHQLFVLPEVGGLPDKGTAMT